jgi:integrase/recombinase XerC
MPTMANYADSTRTPRTLTEREQRALLKVTGEHRAGYRDHGAPRRREEEAAM